MEEKTEYISFDGVTVRDFEIVDPQRSQFGGASFVRSGAIESLVINIPSKADEKAHLTFAGWAISVGTRDYLSRKETTGYTLSLKPPRRVASAGSRRSTLSCSTQCTQLSILSRSKANKIFPSHGLSPLRARDQDQLISVQ